MTNPIDMSIETDLLAIAVGEDEDGFFIEWDETDPRAIEMGINEWTPEQWEEAIEDGLRRVEAADD